MSDKKQPNDSHLSKKRFSRRARLYVQLLIIQGLGFAVTGLLLFVVVPIVLATEEVLKALIQAEATLLGFYGIMTVYVLTSYDGRLGRFEEELFKLATEETTVPDAPLRVGVQQINQALINIEKNKKEFAHISAFVGGSLVMSIILSVLALGSIKDYASSVFSIPSILTVFALYLFFESLAALVYVLYQMGEPPERIKRW